MATRMAWVGLAGMALLGLACQGPQSQDPLANPEGRLALPLRVASQGPKALPAQAEAPPAGGPPSASAPASPQAQVSPPAPGPSPTGASLPAASQAPPLQFGQAPSEAPLALLPLASAAPILGPFSGSWSAGIISNNAGAFGGGGVGQAIPPTKGSPTPLPLPKASLAPEVEQAQRAALIAFRDAIEVANLSKAESWSPLPSAEAIPTRITKVEVATPDLSRTGFQLSFPEGQAQRVWVLRTAPVQLKLGINGNPPKESLTAIHGLLAELRGDGTSYPQVQVREHWVTYQGQAWPLQGIELATQGGQGLWSQAWPPTLLVGPAPANQGPLQLRLKGQFPAQSHATATWPNGPSAFVPLPGGGGWLSQSPLDWTPGGQSLRWQAYVQSDRAASAVIHLHTSHFPLP